jgi:hypothetical protein
MENGKCPHKAGCAFGAENGKRLHHAFMSPLRKPLLGVVTNHFVTKKLAFCCHEVVRGNPGKTGMTFSE